MYSGYICNHMSDAETILRIKTALKQRSMTQRSLARALGKAPSEVSRWLSGAMGISPRNLALISETLGVQLCSQGAVSALLRLGVIGTGSIACRFASEAESVEGVSLAAAYNPDCARAGVFCDRFGIPVRAASPEELYAGCDAVYVASPLATHYDYAREALLAGRHVLCETPFTPTRAQAAELFRLADSKGLRLMVALKTAYCPSFLKILELVRSGAVGEVVDVSATVTTVLPEGTPADFNLERLKENATYPLLAAFKILGTGCVKAFSRTTRDACAAPVFVRTLLEYPQATASLKVGTGVKSEGSLVVSGTLGYIYVPAPWWKTDYFELRRENTSDNRKFYFPYEQAGLRYEIAAFRDAILSPGAPQAMTREENLKMTDILEKYIK